MSTTLSEASKKNAIKYRFLGDSGLLVSKLSLGSWMNYNKDYTADAWYELMAMGFDHGINFFDTAEIYGNGQAEELMGGAVKKGITEGKWDREDLVLTTKIFLGTKSFHGDGPNGQGVSRKHIIEGTKASLRRLQQEYVDVIFCHRYEECTPMEEVVRAMNFVIQQGWAFYWGTSEWSSSEIVDACEIADRLGLVRPIVDQAQYNILERSKVEFDYVSLYKKYKWGLTTWSPLAFGVLTGKYSQADTKGARLTSKTGEAEFMSRVAIVEKLRPIAEELGCTLAQLGIAWCYSNENVSTVILGARNSVQLAENLKAVDFVPKITPEVKAKIDAVVNFVPKIPEHDWFAKLRERHYKN